MGGQRDESRIPSTGAPPRGYPTSALRAESEAVTMQHNSRQHSLGLREVVVTGDEACDVVLAIACVGLGLVQLERGDSNGFCGGCHWQPPLLGDRSRPGSPRPLHDLLECHRHPMETKLNVKDVGSAAPVYCSRSELMGTCASPLGCGSSTNASTARSGLTWLALIKAIALRSVSI